MTRIRVVPDNLRQAALELERIAMRLRDLGREAHQATNAAPSYSGQFGPKARALGMEAEARLVVQSEQVLALSEFLITRAEAFDAVDQHMLSTLDKLIGLIEGWLEQANTNLGPLASLVAFPWQLVNRHLRLGLLIEDPGEGEGGDGDWAPPWWSSIALGAVNVWTWYDRTINRFIYILDSTTKCNNGRIIEEYLIW
jgi:hypothetical protein